MPRGKGAAVWDDPVFLGNVIIGLYEVSIRAGALKPQAKDGIAKYLTQQGHDVTFDAIR